MFRFDKSDSGRTIHGVDILIEWLGKWKSIHIILISLDFFLWWLLTLVFWRYFMFLNFFLWLFFFMLLQFFLNVLFVILQETSEMKVFKNESHSNGLLIFLCPLTLVDVVIFQGELFFSLNQMFIALKGKFIVLIVFTQFTLCIDSLFSLKLEFCDLFVCVY
jgi:hypothetical protein